MLEDGRRKAARDGNQKEETAGSRKAKERVAKAGSKREKAKVYGLSMTSWASGTSSSNSNSRHRRKEHSLGRKMRGEAMKVGGIRALDH